MESLHVFSCWSHVGKVCLGLSAKNMCVALLRLPTVLYIRRFLSDTRTTHGHMLQVYLSMGSPARRPDPARPENGPARPLILARRVGPGQRNLARLTSRAGLGQKIGPILGRPGPTARQPDVFLARRAGLG
jgi:hypothetical protein